MFFVALMPQFVPEHSPWGPTLLLSAIAVALTASWFVFVANVVGALRRLFSSRRVRRTIDAVAGTLLIGLGLGLLMEGEL